MGLYNNSTDERQRAQLIAARDRAAAALDAHKTAQAALDATLAEASAAKQAAQTSLTDFSQGLNHLKTLEQRTKLMNDRLAAAQKEADEYDVGNERGKLQVAACVLARSLARLLERGKLQAAGRSAGGRARTV